MKIDNELMFEYIEPKANTGGRASSIKLSVAVVSDTNTNYADSSRESPSARMRITTKDRDCDNSIRYAHNIVDALVCLPLPIRVTWAYFL